MNLRSDFFTFLDNSPIVFAIGKLRVFACTLLAVFLVGGCSIQKETLAIKTSEPQTGEVFLLPYFLGNGETGIYLSYSYDGLNFKWLNEGKLIFEAPDWPDENLTRDPSILFHDNMFHMVWTTSWWSKTIGYAYSKDLVQWSEPKKISLWQDGDGAKNSWAPELHWDDESEEYFILWSSTLEEELKDNDGSSNRPGRDHRTYITRTSDFNSFSPPELFYSPQSPEVSVIDPYIAKDDKGTSDTIDDQFVMVIKNEMPENKGGKNLRLVFSDNMQGPYPTEMGAPIVGAGTNIVNVMAEGPSLLKKDNLWWLYWDAPDSEFSYCLATSDDLVTWRNRSDEMSMPAKSMRHGTVLLVPTTKIGFLK
ncbi:family 43 glycosylhydrolase [Aestuariibacter sp. A3R04]|uniref:family 43 glycosylhydrolase n=1 Tax=Aestuariibacter sp. A3R04 TaxID=2841571 RepID=UPI001C07EF13|nr:family 43 glycosylhydrolase [Aestuariibacter sp. A3R04]MBU3021354.1 family 43 glycosylhydrolase [Aestuariibacter sp. A3R04]